MNFTCMACGGKRLEEIMSEVVVASEVIGISDGDVSYGEQENEDGTVDRYQCMACGNVIVDEHGEKVTDSEDLEIALNKIAKNDPTLFTIQKMIDDGKLVFFDNNTGEVCAEDEITVCLNGNAIQLSIT